MIAILVFLALRYYKDVPRNLLALIILWQREKRFTTVGLMLEKIRESRRRAALADGELD